LKIDDIYRSETGKYHPAFVFFDHLRTRTTDCQHEQPVAPNLLNREFSATASNTRWVADITAIWVETQFALSIKAGQGQKALAQIWYNEHNPCLHE
jgi:hypothetical protein